jgi:hypothetical protein
VGKKYLAIGAPGDNSETTYTGAVYVYTSSDLQLVR